MTVLALTSATALPGKTPATAATGFNWNVHGARGLLAFMVFCFHVACSGLPGFGFLQSAGEPVWPLLCLQYGVEIFFCISGTIVIGALVRAGSPGRFLWDRIIRIMPVLWATLAVIVPLAIVTHQPSVAHDTAPALAWIIPANMLALPGVFSLPVLHMGAWSLSYEMAFYLIAVCVWCAAPRRVPRYGALVLAAAFIAWQPRAIFFAVGVLVARTDLSRHPVLGRAIQWPLVWLIAFAVLWHFVTAGGADGGAGSLLLWIADGRIGLAALAVSAAILAWAGIVGGHGLICKALRAPPAQWLGSVSYSFYLWHLIVLAMVKRLLAGSGMVAVLGHASQLALFAIALPLSLFVAHVSVCVIERRFVSWLKTHRPAWRGQHAMPREATPAPAITIENTASLAA